MSRKTLEYLPLVTGTLLTTFIVSVASSCRNYNCNIFSEYANRTFKKITKPLLEILAIVPTVVYGFLLLVVVTPFLQSFIPNLSGFNSLSAGIVMGIMIIPYVSSLSEDAYGSKIIKKCLYGMGLNKITNIISCCGA